MKNIQSIQSIIAYQDLILGRNKQWKVENEWSKELDIFTYMYMYGHRFFKILE